MKVLIVGSGAVGLAIAAALWDSGEDVYLVARKQTKKQIEENGIIRTGVFKEIVINKGQIKLFEKISEISDIEFDHIIIATKTTATAEVFLELKKKKQLLKKNGKILIIQNGLEDEEIYLDSFGKEQVFSARLFIGFRRPEPYISEVTVCSSDLMIGSLYNNVSKEMNELAQSIQKGGIPCKIVDNIVETIWAKLLYNAALNPLGTILGVNYGRLIENEYSISIMEKIIEEIFEVIEASDNKTFWKSADEYKKHFFEKLVPSTAQHRASMLQDMEKAVKTEIDSLNGKIVKLGIKYNIKTPVNEMIFNIIKSMESVQS